MKITTGQHFKIIWRGDEVLRRGGAAAQNASKVGAKIVEQTAKSYAPVKTGKLKSEIKIRRSKYEHGGLAIEAQGPGNYTRFYALFVEIGTDKMKAQPYLRPALERKRRTLDRIAQNELNKAFPKR